MDNGHNKNQATPPKRPLSAFFLFKDEKFGNLVAANPTLKVCDIMTLIANQWKQESEESKNAYQQRYSIAKREFDEKMKAYVALHGKPPKKQKKIRKGKGDKQQKKEKGAGKAKGAKKGKSNGTPAARKQSK